MNRENAEMTDSKICLTKHYSSNLCFLCRKKIGGRSTIVWHDGIYAHRDCADEVCGNFSEYVEKCKRGEDDVVPKGMYCYERTKDGTQLRCPYWRSNPSRDYQENGCCLLLDIEDYSESPFSLLWDQCKECGVNDEWDDEENVETTKCE